VQRSPSMLAGRRQRCRRWLLAPPHNLQRKPGAPTRSLTSGRCRLAIISSSAASPWGRPVVIRLAAARPRPLLSAASRNSETTGRHLRGQAASHHASSTHAGPGLPSLQRLAAPPVAQQRLHQRGGAR
jgi:hypothetical protein